MSVFKAVLATLLYVVLLELISAWVFLADYLEFENYFSYYYLISPIIALLFVLPFVLFVNRKSRKVTLRSPIKWYLLAAVFGLSYVFIQTPLNYIYDFISGCEHSISYEFDTPKMDMLVLATGTFLLTPITEEMYFREFLQRRLSEKVSNLWSILIASVLFAAIHLPYAALFIDYPEASPHHAYIALFGGLMNGFLYFKSKSIGPPILSHICWNLMVVLA